MLNFEWTDLFLLEYAPDRSFFQDASSSLRQSINSDDLPRFADDMKRLRTHFESDVKHDFRGALFDGTHIRVECRNTIQGMVYVCRRLPMVARPFNTLGIQASLVKDMMIHGQQQLMLFVGRTGAGKTTAATAFVMSWLRIHGGVGWTVENPVEIDLQSLDFGSDGACFQVEVSNDDDFGHAIRDTMRSLPRLIFVGELRNGHTMGFSSGARAAVHASMTGHVVVSTMHANDHVSAIHALVSMMGGENYRAQVADALGGIFLTSIVQAENGNKRIMISPLFFGQGSDGMRSHIRNGEYHLLASDIDKQRRKYQAG